MKTADVRVGKTYLYNSEIVTVLKRMKGRATNQRNMQSGCLFTGYKCEQKKFLLSNGLIVKSQLLTPLN